MTEPLRPPMHGWLWEMFREFVRKIRRSATMGAPTDEEMAKSLEKIFPESTIKILVQEKVGMILVFHELEELNPEQLLAMAEEEQLMNYLKDKYGGGKFKLNLHHGLTFIATKNFKPEGPEKWRQFVKRAEGG